MLKLCFQPATSLEDKTEDFAGNPTRDALADGLMCMIKVYINDGKIYQLNLPE